jgi:hypothetical protein
VLGRRGSAKARKMRQAGPAIMNLNVRGSLCVARFGGEAYAAFARPPDRCSSLASLRRRQRPPDAEGDVEERQENNRVFVMATLARPVEAFGFRTGAATGCTGCPGISAGNTGKFSSEHPLPRHGITSPNRNALYFRRFTGDRRTDISGSPCQVTTVEIVFRRVCCDCPAKYRGFPTSLALVIAAEAAAARRFARSRRRPAHRAGYTRRRS